MLGLQPSEDSGGPSATSVPQAPQQQQQQQQQPVGAAQHQPHARSGDGASGSSGPVFSRLLEHTASSLARCADRVHHPPPSVAVQQQQQVQQPVAATAAAAPAAAAPATRVAFGSPMPPPRSRSSTSSQDGQAGQPDAGSTPVGAEGLTPEGTGKRHRHGYRWVVNDEQHPAQTYRKCSSRTAFMTWLGLCASLLVQLRRCGSGMGGAARSPACRPTASATCR